MSLPLSILIGSTITLVILTGVFRVEDARGRRLFLGRVRAFIDEVMLRWFGTHHVWVQHLGRGFFRLLFHYFAHGVLNQVLKLVHWLETKLEVLIRQNRQVAKAIGAEKRETHLTAIAEHKAQTALTEREKQKLKAYR